MRKTQPLKFFAWGIVLVLLGLMVACSEQNVRQVGWLESNQPSSASIPMKSSANSATTTPGSTCTVTVNPGVVVAEFELYGGNCQLLTEIAGLGPVPNGEKAHLPPDTEVKFRANLCGWVIHDWMSKSFPAGDSSYIWGVVGYQ